MRARIIATVGPACASRPILRRLVMEGVSVFRLNFSHGTHDQHAEFVKRIRSIQRELVAPISIMQDLAGHRIRTGRLKGGKEVVLAPGQKFALYRGAAPGTSKGVSIDYEGAFERIRRGQMVYIADGTIQLRVVRSTPDRLDTIVTEEGKLGERKGVNIPHAPLEFPPISLKDIEDLTFAVQHRLEFVAQSFVRSAAEVLQVKRRLLNALPNSRVIAKIETPEGIKNIASILRVADGIMVARGDLGITVPIHEVPILQKWIIAACNHVKKPAITATQMLEHMQDHPLPTRAEVSDVANAVIDGSDYLMLSGETASGKYPIEAVHMMRKTIEFTERHAPYRGVRRNR